MAVTVDAPLYGTAVYGVSRYNTFLVSGIDQATATASVGSVRVNLTASLSGVQAQGSISSVSVDGFEIDITERIPTGVSASTLAGSLKVNLKELLEGTQATITLNGEGISIRSINRVPVSGVAAEGATGSLGVSVVERPVGAIATGSVGQPKANLSKVIGSVVATGSVGSLENSNTVTLQGVVSSNAIGVLKVNFTKSITGVSSVVSSGNTRENISTRLITPNLVVSVGDLAETAEVFDFEAVKDLYSRRRTVTISRAA